MKAGFKFVNANKKLYKYVLIPTLINLALFVVLGYLLYNYYTPLYGHLNERMGHLTTTGEGWLNTILSGVIWFFSGILKLLLGLLLVALMVFTLYIVSQIVNSPFYDLLSEASEEIVLGKNETLPLTLARLMRDLKNTLIIELKKMAFFIVVPLLLLILNILPLIGSILYTRTVNIFAAWAFGFNYLSYPLTRKQISFGQQLAISTRFKANLVGLGAPLMIPFFNLLLGPLFVVGGTLMYCDLKKAQIL